MIFFGGGDLEALEICGVGGGTCAPGPRSYAPAPIIENHTNALVLSIFVSKNIFKRTLVSTRKLVIFLFTT